MTPVSLRHRLLEGVLLRLAALPDAGGVVLRGGMLMRHWFRPTPRVAMDLDLVAHSPLTVEDATRFYPMFADNVVDDVTFDLEGIEVEGIWLQSDHPGIRLHVRGACGGCEDDIQVDVTGGPSPVPAAVISELPTSRGAVRLWTCRPESIVGQKVQALWHLGMLGWRPKDLDDLRRLFEHMSMDDSAIREAIGATFQELGGTGRDARQVFGPESWWSTKHASARWGDYVHAAERHAAGNAERNAAGNAVRNLSDVVAGVAARLKPLLEDLP